MSFKELTEMKMCGWQIMIVIVKKWSGKENSKKKHTDRCKNDDIQLVMLLCMLNEMIQSSGTTTWMAIVASALFQFFRRYIGHLASKQ